MKSTAELTWAGLSICRDISSWPLTVYPRARIYLCRLVSQRNVSFGSGILVIAVHADTAAVTYKLVTCLLLTLAHINQCNAIDATARQNQLAVTCCRHISNHSATGWYRP
jgi:hypothetical protein